MPQIIPFLTVFSMGTMIGLMVFVMMTNTRTWLGGACLGLCLTSVIWALGLYNTMTALTYASRVLWHQISAFGWCLYPIAFLLFALEITRMGTPRRRFALLLGTGLSGLFFLVAIWMKPMLFIGRFDRTRWGWGMTKPSDSVVLMLCVTYLAVAGLAHVLLLVHWGVRTRYRMERRQAWLLAGTALFTVLASSIYDILLPINDIPTLGTTPMFSLVFFLALFYCAYQYRLLEPTPSVSAADIMRRVRDLMIVLDRDGCIVQMNASARATLGVGMTDLAGKPWTRILPDVALPEEDHELACDTEMLDHKGERVPVALAASRRYNQDGDCVGYVLTANDMRIHLALQQQGVAQQMAEARFQDETQLYRAVMLEAHIGFLLLDRDARIAGGYAPRSAAVLGRPHLVGMDFPHLALPSGTEEEMHQVRVLIDNLFGEERSWRIESLLTLLPASWEKDGVVIGMRYILPQRAERGDDKHILVILEDRSELVNHEDRLEREHNRMKMVVAVLLNREAFREFTQEVRTWHLLELQTLPETLPDRQKWLHDLFRNIHTFKGGFLRFGLQQTANQFMQYETLLSQWLEREPSDIDVRMLLTRCEPEVWMTEDLQLLREAIGTNVLEPGPMVEVDRNELDRVAREVETRIRNAGIPLEDYRGILHQFRALYSVHAKRLLQEYEPYVQRISRERGLPEPVFAVQGMDVLLDGTQYNAFFRVLIHVFNNIVAHAIESPEDRQAAAKPMRARIECHVESRQGNMLLEIADDGRGIDPEKIRSEWNKRQKNPEDAPQEDDRTIIQHIFEPGYSTVLQADTLSGRGIGLFAVAHAAQQLGGSVWVQSRTGAFTRFLFSIPLKARQQERRSE